MDGIELLPEQTLALGSQQGEVVEAGVRGWLGGGIGLDGGMAAARAFVEPLIGPVAKATLASEADRDAKSRLQEWSQAELGVTPRYRIIAEKGPDHAKTFVAEVLLDGEVAGQGIGRSKQAAEQEAAQAAWESLTWPDAAASEASPANSSLR